MFRKGSRFAKQKAATRSKILAGVITNEHRVNFNAEVALMNFTYWLYCPRAGRNVIVITKFTLPVGDQKSRFVRTEHCSQSPPCKSINGDCQAPKVLEFDSSEGSEAFEQAKAAGKT